MMCNNTLKIQMTKVKNKKRLQYFKHKEYVKLSKSMNCDLY